MIRIELNFRNLLLLLGLLIFGWLVWRAHEVLVMLCFSLMIMAALQPLVNLAERRGLSHGWAVALAMLALVLVPLLILGALSPLIISEVQGIANDFPHLQSRIDELLRNAGLASRVNDILQHANLQDRLGSLAVVSAQQTVSTITQIFTVIVIAGYLLADGRRIRLWIHVLMPRNSERHIDPILAGLERVVGGYIRGQVITSALFGAFAVIVCLIFRVHYPLLLGIIAALGDIIPIFGVPLAMVITGAVALVQSVWQPIGVLAAYSVYQQIEGHVLIPRVYSRTINMPPLLVIVATIAGGSIAGIVGILIGIPIAGAIKVVFDYVVAERLRGQEAAREQMLHSDTDIVGKLALETGSEKGGKQGAESEHKLGPDEAITPTYSPFETIPEQRLQRKRTRRPAPRQRAGASRRQERGKKASSSVGAISTGAALPKEVAER